MIAPVPTVRGLRTRLGPTCMHERICTLTTEVQEVYPRPSGAARPPGRTTRCASLAPWFVTDITRRAPAPVFHPVCGLMVRK
jgi:hypothetical protein